MTVREDLPALLAADAVGLKLYRIDAKERLIGCETVMFNHGRPAVEMTLRRANLSGRVEVEGKIENHFADVYTAAEEWVQTVALDRRSYNALKNHWMRCKVEDLDNVLGRRALKSLTKDQP